MKGRCKTTDDIDDKRQDVVDECRRQEELETLRQLVEVSIEESVSKKMKLQQEEFEAFKQSTEARFLQITTNVNIDSSSLPTRTIQRTTGYSMFRNLSFAPIQARRHIYSSLASQENQELINMREFHFDPDTYSLMMISRPGTKPWIVGLFIASFFQLGLGTLIVHSFIREYRDSCTERTADGKIICLPFDVPIRVTPDVTFAQFIAIILVLVTQSDTLPAIQTIVTLQIGTDHVQWEAIVLGSDKETNGKETSKTWYIWITRILLPNTMKILQNVIVIFASFVSILVRSKDIIDLLKDCTAVLFISEGDNIGFHLARMGYLGHDVAMKAEEVINARICVTRYEDDAEDSTTNATPPFSRFRSTSCETHTYLSILLMLLCCVMIGGWMYFVHGQISGRFVILKFPDCEKADPSLIGDGTCQDKVPYNTAACGFDAGDCVAKAVDGFPGCFVVIPELIGDGLCDGNPIYNTVSCGYKGGDCQPVDGFRSCFVATSLNVTELGDGVCSGDPCYNTVHCQYEGGDCQPVDGLPTCFVDDASIIGDGVCSNNPLYNVPDCQYEGGDCKPVDGYPSCFIDALLDTTEVSNGECRGDPGYNSVHCQHEGSDCQPVDGLKDCFVAPTLNVTAEFGDGVCSGDPRYNTIHCQYKGGDCVNLLTLPFYPVPPHGSHQNMEGSTKLRMQLMATPLPLLIQKNQNQILIGI